MLLIQYTMMERLGDLEQILLRVHQFAVDAVGDHHTIVADRCTDLALLYRRKEEYETATFWQQKALGGEALESSVGDSVSEPKPNNNCDTVVLLLDSSIDYGRRYQGGGLSTSSARPRLGLRWHSQPTRGDPSRVRPF